MELVLNNYLLMKINLCRVQQLETNQLENKDYNILLHAICQDKDMAQLLLLE